MAAGHLASLFNFALLATLHQFHFDPVGGASGQANNDAVAALAGIPLEDLKLAEWHNSIMRPCHYLAVDRANHCIVLSIRQVVPIGLQNSSNARWCFLGMAVHLWEREYGISLSRVSTS